MEFEFSIPIRLTDLQTKQGLTDYAVSEVFSARVLPTKLADMRKALRNFDKDTVIQHFDSLYSVLCDKTCKESGHHETAWVCVMKSLDHLHTTLRTSLEGGVKDPKLRNSLMMALYLATEYINLLENEHNKPTKDQIITGKKKSKAKSKNNDNLSMDWEMERCRAIKSITQLMSLPVQRLWDPPMVEQNLVNCIGNCLFKLLQNPATSKSKDFKEECFQLLACLIKRRSYSLTAAIQAMENLKLFDHMAPLMAEAMAVIAREFSYPKTAQDLLREISSLGADYLQRDNTAAKSYSTFLTELADMIPDVILPVISILLPFLEDDPPSMRIAMLVVLGKLIMNLLTGDNLDDNKKNVREEFLDILCEHMHDVNGFVRSKVLQILLAIVESRTLPLTRYIQVATLTHGRLMDKLANVRKNAIQLMIVLVTHNPYGTMLSDKHLAEALETEKTKFTELKEKIGSAALPASALVTPAENWEAMLPEIEKAVRDYVAENGDPDRSTDDESFSLEESATLDSVKEDIISLLNRCMPADAVKLMMRGQSSFPALQLVQPDNDSGGDDEELIIDKLKSTFLEQKVPEEPMSVDEEVGSQLKEELTKQQVVVKCYEETYKFCTLLQDTMPTICKLLSSNNSTDVVESIQFVVNTVQYGITDAIHGLAAMLKLVWVEANSIKSAVVQAFRLLYLYSDDSGESREPGRVVASLIALSKTFTGLFGQQMAWEELVAEFVRSDDISSQVLQLLWDTFTLKIPNTLAIDSKIALKLIATAAKAKPAIVSSNMDTLMSEGLSERARGDLAIARDICIALLSLKGKMPRMSKDNEFVTGFTKILEDSVKDMSQATWIPLMEYAIKFVYDMSETPDVTCANLIKHIYSQVFSADSTQTCNYTHLTRFVALVGQVAMCQLVYLEVDVLQDAKKKRQSKNKDASTDSASGGDELGQTSSDDLETEIILKVIQHELLNESNLLVCFLPLLVHLLVNRSKFDDDSLQAAATLALGKYMLISPQVCSENLRLYFTILEKSKCKEVKTNAVVALSDMVFRYPNELEPWTPNLYARLRDECPTVRKVTLMVMTRLILNDMVKVKGQISEIAVCLVDGENAIKEMAAQFFTELASKGYTMYNALLDIVSRLSDPEVGVDEESFRTICTELFNHISVDKQCETLMERFLLRFRATTDERQWRDIAFCLSRLSYTEKSIKILIEKFSCFADKFADEDIHESFMAVIEKATQRLKLKPGAKEVIAELSAKIEVAHSRGVEDADALDNAAEVAPKKKLAKATRRKTKRSRKSRVNSDDDEDELSDASVSSRLSTSSNVSVTQRPSGTRRSARKAMPMKPLENLLDELREGSDEDQVENFTKTPLKPKAERLKLVFSSSDEDELSLAAAITPAPPPKRRSARSRKK